MRAGRIFYTRARGSRRANRQNGRGRTGEREREKRNEKSVRVYKIIIKGRGTRIAAVFYIVVVAVVCAYTKEESAVAAAAVSALLLFYKIASGSGVGGGFVSFSL